MTAVFARGDRIIIRESCGKVGAIVGAPGVINHVQAVTYSEPVAGEPFVLRTAVRSYSYSVHLDCGLNFFAQEHQLTFENPILRLARDT